MTLDQDRKLLVKTFRRIKSARVLLDFLDDLLTEEEIISLAQRLRIAKFILKKKTYEDISIRLSASTATITKIGQVIKYGKGGLVKVFPKSKASWQL